MRLIPQNDYLILDLEVIAEEERIGSSGLIKPVQAIRIARETGIVLAVGPGYLLQDGTRGELGIKVGDRVLITPNAPVIGLIDNQEIIYTKASNVIAIIEKEKND